MPCRGEACLARAGMVVTPATGEASPATRVPAPVAGITTMPARARHASPLQGPEEIPLEGLLYGEDGARAVVSCAPGAVEAVLALGAEHGVPVFRAGRVGTQSGPLELRVDDQLFTWSVKALRKTYFEAIPRRMQHPDVDRGVGA